MFRGTPCINEHTVEQKDNKVFVFDVVIMVFIGIFTNAFLKVTFKCTISNAETFQRSG